jgi:2-succinyl-6-hydroxy-2,4-cyclohexadiene-1-carboxylate synthase
MGAKEDFTSLCEELSSLYYCISIDLPGFGSSPFTLSGNPWKDLLSEISAFIKEHHLEKLSLIGYSMGGRIAHQLISYLPQIDHLFILSARLSPLAKDLQQKKTNQWLTDLEKGSLEEFLRSWYKQPLFSTLEEKGLIEPLIQKRKLCKKEVIAYYLRELSSSSEPLQNALYDLKKGLFLFGEKDKSYADHYTLLQKEHPHLTFKEIIGSSHALLEECSQEVAKKIINFRRQSHGTHDTN